MLSKVISELISDRVVSSKMRLDQKFTFEFKVRRTKSADEQSLAVEVMHSGTYDDSGKPEYKIKMAGDTLPIHVNATGMAIVLQATLMQFKVVDFAESDKWFSIIPRTHDDYDGTARTVGSTTGLFRLRLAR